MADLRDARIGCAMTGSFCTFKAVFEAWRALRDAGAELTPIMSFNAATVDTRFYPAAEAVALFREISGRRPLTALNEVEPIGPRKLLDNALRAVKGENTMQVVEDFTAEMTLVARFEMLPETLKCALEGRQIQPVLRGF